MADWPPENLCADDHRYASVVNDLPTVAGAADHIRSGGIARIANLLPPRRN
ncbi:hypothetical protein ACGFIR_15930 [Micromonospora sp. NPDC049051]|uniref:hypothetical protein n=1 Tax=Micromonospora sp. NPDC049051 TaxID=3364264 RepID=UPI00372198B0